MFRESALRRLSQGSVRRERLWMASRRELAAFWATAAVLTVVLAELAVLPVPGHLRVPATLRDGRAVAELPEGRPRATPGARAVLRVADTDLTCAVLPSRSRKIVVSCPSAVTSPAVGDLVLETGSSTVLEQLLVDH
ncbi:hypothetical protein [Nonomuraea sp. NPDC003804]|uniref:hypothetical protein n=1 Tax=Nonomuraea sp. NPDC003804 TaxID=3154547 RepID=UPI0033AD83FC